jgi:hypothetical protein
LLLEDAGIRQEAGVELTLPDCGRRCDTIADINGDAQITEDIAAWPASAKMSGHDGQ